MSMSMHVSSVIQVCTLCAPTKAMQYQFYILLSVQKYLTQNLPHKLFVLL